MIKINLKKCSFVLLLFLITTTGFTAELNFISPSELITPNTTKVLGVSLEVSGTSSANDGISSVSIAVLDTSTSKWLGKNGWQEAWTDLKPDVTETSTTSANWSITLNLGSKGSGNYMLLPGFNDKKGAYHIKSAWERYFSARAPQTRIPSEIRYTTPASNQSIQLPLKISGSVTSPTGIAQLGLGIMDRNTFKWWDANNNRWSDSWKGVETTLSNISDTSANWSYQFNPKTAIGSGSYRIFASYSDADWRYTTTTWKRNFNGVTSAIDSNMAPKISLTAPQDNKSVMLPFTIRGNAMTANGVEEVGLGLLDLTTYKWWGNGKWNDNWVGLKTNLITKNSNPVNWQYTFKPGANTGSGKYRILAGMSDRNWKYYSHNDWVWDFTKQIDGPVRQLSSGVYELKDLVEYGWLVGCVPTGAAMMIGYWDRNGYGGLITGDSTRQSQAIKDFIFSEGHTRDYYQPTDIWEYGGDPHGIVPDKSEGVPTHEDDSIADFALASRSAFNLDIGVSSQTATASGVHGWANRRGYGGFTTKAYGFGWFSFEQFRENILAGRPMNLAVSTNGKTDNINHVVLGVAFNDNTNEVGILDGWKASDPANPPKVRWIKWQKVGLGIPWGIGWVLEVIPPEKSNLQGPNTGLLENRGGSKAYYRDGFTGSANNFNVLQHSKISNLGASTIALASANGHRFWHLIDDGSGTAALYQGESRGDGNFIWLKLSDNTGANRTTTVGLATADGKVFWQLWDDGVGTLALVERKLELPQRTLTKVSTRRLDTGLSRSNTLGVAMENSNTLLAYVKSGNNNVSIYSLNVSNHSSTPKLVKSNITGMDDLIDVVRFKRNATVASDGDGAVQSRGLAQRDIDVPESIDVSGEDRENWGVAESVDTDQYGEGVIQPRLNSSSDSEADNGDEAFGNDSVSLESFNATNSNEGGGGSISLLLALMGLLLLWLNTTAYRRATPANRS